MSKDVSPKIYVPLFLVTGIALLVIFMFRIPITDWWYFLSYEPSLEVERLAEDSGMSEEGTRLFYRTDPELVSVSQLANRCEQIELLGCIVPGPKVYIQDFEVNTEEYDQAVVTAAHEMLHMAYFRLSDEERENVNQLLEDARLAIRDQRVIDRINSYSEEERLDEMHSIIATEVSLISPQLENYYDAYFDDDREDVLEAYRQSASLLR